MASALFRLLALFALMLMPGGMTGAPALAQPGTASSHCDEHQLPADAPIQPQAHCTGCAALPALDAPPALGAAPPDAPAFVQCSEPVSGITLEIATPPPKLG
jgi:hypothetical protein